MEWLHIAIGSIITLTINIIIISYGYGKLTQKAEQNKEKISNLQENCKNYRDTCHLDNVRIDSEIFKKLDELKSSMNDNFLKLSIQVAKLEKQNEI